jgi:hypothetical protein
VAEVEGATASAAAVAAEATWLRSTCSLGLPSLSPSLSAAVVQLGEPRVSLGSMSMSMESCIEATDGPLRHMSSA